MLNGNLLLSQETKNRNDIIVTIQVKNLSNKFNIMHNTN